MRVVERVARDRVAHLRAELLTGRGPGAPAEEIAVHTRDRLLLCAVPATPGYERPEEAAGLELPQQAGDPLVRATVASRRRGQLRAALVGAASALLAQSIAVRLFPAHRRPEPEDAG